MGEIIHVQLGTLANQFGTGYWEMIAGEHGLDETGGGSASVAHWLVHVWGAA